MIVGAIVMFVVPMLVVTQMAGYDAKGGASYVGVSVVFPWGSEDLLDGGDSHAHVVVAFWPVDALPGYVEFVVAYLERQVRGKAIWVQFLVVMLLSYPCPACFWDLG